jgi:uncharacterized protein (UPF0210 family)
MIRDENLDIRTVTMGISLFDCVSDDENRLNDKIYDKITKSAENLVSECEKIEKEYGIQTNHEKVIMSPVSGCHNGPWLAGYGYLPIRREDEELE